MSSAGRRYLAETGRLLAAAADEGSDAVAAAAGLVARAVAAGGLVHAFGTGHSHLLAEKRSTAPVGWRR